MPAYESRQVRASRNFRKAKLTGRNAGVRRPESVDGTVGFTPRLGSTLGAAARRERLVSEAPARERFRPLHTMRMGSLPWQMLHWLLGREMDEHGNVHLKNWKVEASKAIGTDRIHAGRAAYKLMREGLIEFKRNTTSHVRVHTERMVTE